MVSVMGGAAARLAGQQGLAEMSYEQQEIAGHQRYVQHFVPDDGEALDYELEKLMAILEAEAWNVPSHQA